jgi:two-component system chemotaxis sensor kinase CheA
MDQARYADLFRAEAREHLAELDTTLLAFEQDADPAHIATLFRSTHTIKGMAASMGYRAVEQLSHAMESVLDSVRGSGIALDAHLLELLFEGTDALRASVDDAVDGRGELVPAALTPLLDRLGALHLPSTASATVAAPLALDGLTHGAAFDEPPVIVRRDTLADGHAVHVRLTADCPLKGVRALLVLSRLEALGAVLGIEPAQSTWQDDAFDGVFTVSLRSSSAPDALVEAVQAAGDVARVTVSALAAEPRRETAGDALRTVRVDRRRLDTMLDLVGELVITRDRLLRIAEESDQSSTRALTRAAHDTARLIGALQDEVVQARMVPVGQVFDRFPRLVRDVARELGKDVQFVTEGREIELDRSLLDAIGDPLVHLLRNALDHGIEDPETRRNTGKPPTGRLVLRAARDRAAVILQVEDDGRGIDRQVILRRAHQQGLMPQEVESLDDDALVQVLAHAGFSTAKAVTSISGRGVGVDVVATRVRALGGVLEIETLPGQGTVFTMRLPVTLAIARALLVELDGSTYALPAVHVVEALAYDPGMIVTGAERESITLRDEVLPLVHLRERFGQRRRLDDAYLAVVEVAGRRIALVVDALIAQQDIVVKPFDMARGSAPWFSGATVLGDGTPALIVDLGSLT